MGSPAAGDSPVPESRGRVWLELIALYVVTLLLIRGVVELNKLGLHEIFLALVPILFMYAPVALCRWRGVDSYSYPLALPAFRDKTEWCEAAKLALIAIALIFVPFLLSYHYWQTWMFPFAAEQVYELTGLGGPVRPSTNSWTWPSNPLMLVGYHLFFVAIPEEFFYRGYMQSRFDEVYRKRWRVFGTQLGPGWLITCVLFAFGHSFVLVQWWHFAIIFPSLVFGWMRERTGGIVASAFFHAWCNITVSTLDTLYGIVPP